MKISPWTILYYFFFVEPLALVHAMQPDFGPKVTVFDPSMPASTIQSAVDAVSQVQA